MFKPGPFGVNALPCEHGPKLTWLKVVWRGQSDLLLEDWCFLLLSEVATVQSNHFCFMQINKTCQCHAQYHTTLLPQANSCYIFPPLTLLVFISLCLWIL